MEKMQSRKLEIFLYYFVGLIIFLFGLAIFLYVCVFGNSLPSNTSDWSNFGGFFGNSFAVLISFATLIALIITIHLQKELLQTQNQEYQRLYELQKNSLDSQVEQLTLSKISYEKSNLELVRQSFLNLINQKISYENEIINYVLATLSKMLDIGSDGTEEKFIKLAEQKNSAMLKRKILSNSFLKISISNYSSLEELKEDFIKEYGKFTDV